MTQRKGLDQEPGATPDIRAEGDDVTFRFTVAGVPERMKLALRCNAKGELWVSIVTEDATETGPSPERSEAD